MDNRLSAADTGVAADCASDLAALLLQRKVERFLFREAALLDARRYPEWLELLAEDHHYWMPIRRTVTNRDIDREFTSRGAMAYFDEDYKLMSMRVRKLGAPSAWSENPASRSRHFVSNIVITEVVGDEITVECCFWLHRTRLNTEVDGWTGRRVDRLRRQDDSFLIVAREIYLDQTLIRASNMSTLF
jgi:3-phenylpropionate/cinnamic acid dioxygenase small subunit